MNRILLLFFLVVFLTPLHAQQILWGVNYSGGTVNGTGNGTYGRLVKYDPVANTVSYPQNFYSAYGSNPSGTPSVFSDGNVYGTTNVGYSGNAWGKVWKFNTSDGTMSAIHTFTASTGQYPHGNIVEAPNGKAYGVTERGGTNNLGVIYEIDIANATFSKKIDLSSAGGSQPMTGMVYIGSTKFLGTTQLGGANNLGVLFEYDYSTNTYTKKIDFDGTNGSKPWGAPVKGANGKYYGMTTIGGTNNLGVIYEYDHAANTLTVKQQLSSTTGSNPISNLYIAGDEMMYGMAEFGGTNNKGTLFQYDYVNNVFTKKIDFDGSGNGAQPQSALVENDGRLYGMTGRGGGGNNGTIFEYDYISNTLTKKFEWGTHIYGTGFPFMSGFSVQTCPEVTITGQPANTTVCSSGSGTFSVTATGTNLTYQWQVKAGAGGYSNISDNSTYSGATTATLTVTSASSLNGNYYRCKISSSGCASYSNNAILTVTSDPAVVPDVSIAITSGSSTICSGSSVTFEATPTHGGSTPHYQWKVDGNNVGTNSATYTSSSLTEGAEVTCVMTSNAVCASPSSATSSAIIMNVTTTVTPSVSINITAGSNSICSGTSVTFKANPTHGGSTPSYQWKVNTNNVGTDSEMFTSTSLGNGDVVTCVMTSNESCVTSATATSGQVIMSVSSPVTPTVSISIISGSNSICQGTSVTFEAFATHGGSNPAYLWKVNGNNAGTNSNTFTSSSLGNGDEVTCELTSNAACATSATVTSSGITMSVTASVTPSISIAIVSGNDEICEGTSVTFEATISGGGSSPVYQWKVNGNNVGTNSTTFTTTSLDNLDEITCELTSNAACATTSVVTSTEIDITVHEAVTADAGTDQNVIANFATLQGINPSSGSGIWTLVSGTGTILNPTDAIATVTGLSSGNNVFRWTVENGLCTDFDEVTITVGTTGVINGFTAGHSLFPNPFENQTTVNIHSGAECKLQLVVRDAAGATLSILEATTNEDIQFGHNLQPGIYFVEAMYDNKVAVFKVIKSK